MAFKKKYQGIFTNSQADYTDNSGNEQDIYVTIYDKGYEAISNPYQLEFSAEPDNGLQYINIAISIGYDTSNYSSVEVQYTDDGGLTWTAGLTQASPVQGTTYYNAIAYIAGLQYRVQFNLISPPDEEIWYIEDDITISLEMAGTPVTINVIDTNEDKFTVVRGKSAEINILSSNEVNISTFAEGGDNNFLVEIAVGSEANIVFTGWLSQSDLSETLQVYPNVLRLTATDGLGFLKDEALTEIDGSFFNKENKLIDYIAACLYKTGLRLDIVCEMNVMEETAPLDDSGHLYNFIYVHAGTFEKTPEEFEDSNTVLSKILGEMCFISQQKNQWFIKRIDEYDTQDCKRYKYKYDGTPVGYLTETRYDKNIGSDTSQYTLAFMNDDAEIVSNRPLKEVRHTFRYDTLEIPCNGTFTRGLQTGTLPDEVIGGVTYTVKTFALDCWNNYEDENPPNHQVDSPNAYFIKRWYDQKGYQKFSDVVINSPASVAGASRLEHEAIPMEKDDYFSLNYNFKWSSNASGGNANFLQCHIRLEGDDGSVWFWEDNDNSWHLSDSVWTGIRTISKNWTPDDVDEGEWQSVSVDVGKLPVNGYVTVAIYWGNFPESIGRDLHIAEFKIDYSPFINSSYISIAGQEHKSEQTGNYIGKREADVYLSDSPKLIFKGTLLKLDDGAFAKAGYFYNGYLYPTVPGDDYLLPFGQIQNQDVWNQYNRAMISIDGTIDGVDSDKTDIDGLIDLPDLRHSYFLKDGHTSINNRHFTLLHYRQDLDLCEQDMYLTEVLNTTIAKQYTGHSFKYLAND